MRVNTSVRLIRIALVLMSGVISRASAAQELGWGGSIEASANILFGAARGRLVALKAGTQRADSALEVQGDVLLSYADAPAENEEREVTARALRMSLGVDHRPFETLSPFWFGSIESSLQQRIDRRYSTGAGAKYTFFREGDDDVSASLAILWEHTPARGAITTGSCCLERGRRSEGLSRHAPPW